MNVAENKSYTTQNSKSPRAAADPVVNIFEPDILLPQQDSGKKAFQESEIKLMAAILTEGIESYIHGMMADTEDPELLEAQAWVQSKDDNYIFSFEAICRYLSIDPGYVREGLVKFVADQKMKRELQRAANSSDFGSNVSNWKKIRRPRK